MISLCFLVHLLKPLKSLLFVSVFNISIHFVYMYMHVFLSKRQHHIEMNRLIYLLKKKKGGGKKRTEKSE